MPLQRSDLNHSFGMVFDREFWIEPEYLETEEIKHELRIRNVSAGGIEEQSRLGYDYV